ncbi:MAG: ThiF family adenylyltransferase, partial [Clostridia bacterium]|nr:ThiF family adenylyltransferase [Clostridia bacterium]
ESNINRQIIATENTVGLDKTEVIKDRLLSINSKLNLNVFKIFYLPENADSIDLSSFDYIIDAVDTVSAKLEIIKRAYKYNVPVISCMGTGGKTDINSLKVCDIEKTSVCPLARVMRRELRALNISGVKVVYSTEDPVKEIPNNGEKNIPSMIFVPATAGLLMAKEVIFDLINKEK